jgi:hypothetical protein
MRPHFLVDTPQFGTKHKPKSPSYQQRSPYYWWWAYLQRNKHYITYCTNKYKSSLAKLYDDFGDVRSDDFKTWWKENDKGVKLFAEQPSYNSIVEIQTAAELKSEWNKDQLMVIAVPLTRDKKDLRRIFGWLLRKRHTAKRGRKAAFFKQSTALYKIQQNYTIENLRISLKVYDLYHYYKDNNIKKTLWMIGEELRLNLNAMSELKDDHYDRTEKRKLMSVIASRYIKQATMRIENVAKGIFP